MTPAEEAARAWGTPAAPPHPVTERENAVYEAVIDGRRGALRLHRPGYQSAAAISSELRWTEALAEAGFPCPRPIRTREGMLVATLGDGRHASFIAWIDGSSLAAEPPSADTFADLGRRLADLHRMTDRLMLRDIDRPLWDADAFLGPDPLWGRFWKNPALTKADIMLLQRARTAAASRLHKLGAPDMGLIHADLLPENVLRATDGLWLIDFDDSGWGYRGYDLGTALIRHWDHPDFPTLRDALTEGYAARRRIDADEIALFILLRAFASAGWIVPRAAPDDPRVAMYARRAVAIARWALG